MRVLIVIGFLAWAIVLGVALWDVLRPYRQSREARRLASLGEAKNHQEARWRDDGGDG